VKEKKMSTTTRTKPGRLTDSKWWFCEIGQHDKCTVEVELSSRFEGCPCECHQKSPQPAPDAEGEWRVVPEPVAPILAAIHDGDKIIASCMTTETANRILRDHSAVPRLVEALQRRVSPTKCYCEVMLGAKCGECTDRELLLSLGAALSARGTDE
jgi:hypothetical protein